MQVVESPFLLKRAKIAKIIQENENTRRFLFEVEDFPEFKPGQFNMLYVYGQGEVPVSISSLRRDYIEHTVRLAGDVTEDLFKLGEGDYVGLRGPYGTHFPVEDFKGMDLIIVAGGLGFADLKPVIEYVIENRKDYGKVYVLVGAKTPSGLLYKDHYDEWSESVELLLTVDKPDKSWKGNVGVVTTLFKFVEVNPDKSAGMMCGPEIMMYFTTKEMLKLGLKEENVFLSMERHMKCAVGTCGHCQFGYTFVCKNGPIYRYSEIKKIFGVKEV